MPDAFVAAVAFVIDRLEGGGHLVHDSGGATRWGISHNANPDIDIESLTRDQAVRLYYDRYWRPSRADELPEPLALSYFAAVVNIGFDPAVRCLQRALGTVTVDGILGPRTLTAITHYPDQRELRARFHAAVLEHYLDLAERRPYYRQWRRGWFVRVCRAADEAGAWSVRS